jgi:hypothetical protein
LVLSERPPRHNNDLPSLVMTTTSPHLQTRGGDYSMLGSLGKAAKSQPRPPLNRKHKVGVILCLIPYHTAHGSVQPSCHDHHPLSSSGGCRGGQERTTGRENEGNERTAGGQTTRRRLGPSYVLFFSSLYHPLTICLFVSLGCTCHHPHPLTTPTAMSHCSWGGGSSTPPPMRRHPRPRATACRVEPLLCHRAQGAPLPLPGPPHLL